MERKLYLLSPLQAEFYENESDRMYPDDVMDGRALAWDVRKLPSKRP